MRDKTLHGDTNALISAATLAPDAARAHPTHEHYLPFLIALGAARAEATLEVLDGGFTYGVIGMESCVWHPAELAATLGECALLPPCQIAQVNLMRTGSLHYRC